MTLVRAALTAIVDFALPHRCASCGDLIDRLGLCAPCWSSLIFLGRGGCSGCGAPIAALDLQCGTCLANPPAHDGAIAALVYGNAARTIVARLKYGGRPGLAGLMTNQLEALARGYESPLLVPVPLHRLRLWKRGFNQSALLAKALSRRIDAPVSLDSLVRVKPTPPLHGLNPSERKRAVKGAFEVRDNAVFAGRNILLVDDVYTTGATVDACAKSLKRAGAKQIHVLCWARALKADEQHP
jgi:ComF family protein